MRGKVVAITGASRDIGAATAKVFAAAGAQLMLLARNKAELDDLAAEIGQGAMAIRCDVADFGAVEAAFAQTLSARGPLEALIGNAGLIEPVARIGDAVPDGASGRGCVWAVQHRPVDGQDCSRYANDAAAKRTGAGRAV